VTAAQRERNEIFESIVVEFLLRPWGRRLLELAHLRPGERVLDVACCTGTMARLAAECVGETGKVTGLDPDKEALSFARSLPPGPGAPITWVASSAEALPLPDASFDAVFCHQGLQFFADRPAGLREMHRVLAPAGRIAVGTWTGPTLLDLALREALAPYASDELMARMLLPTSLGDPEELQRLLDEAGFRDVRVVSRSLTLRYPRVNEFLPTRLRTGPTADLVASLDVAARERLIEEVRLATEHCADAEGLSVPSENNLATAKA